jgi:formamidopyrimidine-DNA glycosylase
MPELPEVEITKKTLQKYVENQYIADIKINNYNLRYKIDKNFKTNIRGKKINKITRRSKYLIFHLSDKNFFILHLGMSGRILISKNKDKDLLDTSFYSTTLPIHKHNHLYFIFKNNTMIYNDTRRFGFIKYYTHAQFLKCQHLIHLGVEPLSKKLNFKFFKRKIVQFNKAIKNILMDQTFICGLGNIYVNEALFLSKINPNRKAPTLEDREITLLIKSIKTILTKSISLGGSTIRDFHNSEGKSGEFQNSFKVYGKENEKCPRKKCNELIKKIIIAGRATFFCSSCQKE